VCDEQTDGRTEFSSLYRIITCSAVKITTSNHKMITEEYKCHTVGSLA